MVQRNLNALEHVKECYTTWADSYFKEYCSPGAAYPPVHFKLLRRLLKQHHSRSILDAGCGPASWLRTIASQYKEIYGFDVTPSMVYEARRQLARYAIPADHIWEGSVTDSSAYQAPRRPRMKFDAAVCIGVLPHVPARYDAKVIRNLRRAVNDGGLVVIEARNQLFSLFTLNRYAYDFFARTLIGADALKKKVPSQATRINRALSLLSQRFLLRVPPVRGGKRGEPGYDEVLSRTHNPFELRELMERQGFNDVRVLFYHYHRFPPYLAKQVPQIFLRESIAMEGKPSDWRGHFMASAFFVVGTKA